MLLQLRLTPTLAGYGRDFTCEGKDPLQFACNATARQTVSYFRAKNMLSGSAPVLANVTLTTARRFNTTSQSPSFNYHDKRDGTIHQVAYEDSQSLGSKYALARELGLRGVGFWVASGRWPDQAPASTAGLDAMWGSVRKNFLGKTDDRAAALQKEIDQAVASNAPATIFVSGLYNFSRRSLLIAGAKGLTLQPKKSCVAPTCVPKMIFSVWPCGETEGENAAVCRQINFSDPTVLQCKAASGQRCACADVVWSSGVNISNSHDVTVRGIAIDYSPRGLGTTATCKPGPVPPPPPPDTPTKQFNSGRKFSYLLFNSSRVVTEDLQILSAPFMAITSFLGSGGHIFRRVRFVPDPNDFNAIIALKDGLHESDVRTGLQFIDSTIHGTADDFFNFHNTLQLVYRCDASSSSCLIVNPHIDGVPLNTVYGSGRVLSTVRLGDVFTFYPLTHVQHPENSTPPLLATLTVAAKEEVTDAATLKDVSAWAHTTATDKANGLMAFDLWNISFHPSSADFSKLASKTLVNIDSISGRGAVIRNCSFSVTACNLGRTKSSDSIITGTTFSRAKDKNLEVTGLQVWFEGPLRIENVTITENTFVGEGHDIIHVSKLAKDVHISDNVYANASRRLQLKSDDAPARKNIMYVVVDDLRGELGYMSKAKGLITPNVNALAEKGTIFESCYVQQTVCSPSRNSWLSGRRPDTTKVWNFLGSFRDSLGDRVTSMPGAFLNAGFNSVGQGKVYHQFGESPWGGFRDTEPPNEDGNLSYSVADFPYYHAKGYTRKISNAPDSSFQDGMVTDTAIARMKPLAESTRPFFLAVGLHKPHVPWIMPQRFLDMQLPLAETDIASRDTPADGYCNVSLFRCSAEFGAASDPMLDRPLNLSMQQLNRQHYRAAVSWMDFLLGRLVAGLEANGLTESTAVVFHGDHGWNLGDQGMWCKQTLFETNAQIPLLVFVPWLPQSHGQRVAALVEAVDIYPSLTDLVGISHTIQDWDELEGDSFLPLLLNPAVPVDSWKGAAFTQHPRCNGTAAIPTDLPCKGLTNMAGRCSTGQLPDCKCSLPPQDYPTANGCVNQNATDFAAMGHSIRTQHWRYTRWMKWQGVATPPHSGLDGGRAVWDEVLGEELYSHSVGEQCCGFSEHENLAAEPAHQADKARLAEQLKAGWRAARPGAKSRGTG